MSFANSRSRIQRLTAARTGIDYVGASGARWTCYGLALSFETIKL